MENFLDQLIPNDTVRSGNTVEPVILNKEQGMASEPVSATQADQQPVQSSIADNEDFLSTLIPSDGAEYQPAPEETLTGGYSPEAFGRIQEARKAEESIIGKIGGIITAPYKFVSGAPSLSEEIAKRERDIIDGKNLILEGFKDKSKEVAHVSPWVLPGGIYLQSLYAGAADTIVNILEGEKLSDSLEEGALSGVLTMATGGLIKALPKAAQWIANTGSEKLETEIAAEALESFAKMKKGSLSLNDRAMIEVGEDLLQNKKYIDAKIDKVNSVKESAKKTYDAELDKISKNYSAYKKSKGNDLDAIITTLDDGNKAQAISTTKMLRGSVDEVKSVFDSRYKSILKGRVGEMPVELDADISNKLKKLEINVPDNMTVEKAHHFKQELYEEQARRMRLGSTSGEGIEIGKAMEDVIDAIDGTLSKIDGGVGDMYSLLSKEYKGEYIALRNSRDKLLGLDKAGGLENAIKTTNEIAKHKIKIDDAMEKGIELTMGNFEEGVAAYKYYNDMKDVLLKYGKTSEAKAIDDAFNNLTKSTVKIDSLLSLKDGLAKSKPYRFGVINEAKANDIAELDSIISDLKGSIKTSGTMGAEQKLSLKGERQTLAEQELYLVNLIEGMDIAKRSRVYHILASSSYAASMIPEANTKLAIKGLGMLLSLKYVLPKEVSKIDKGVKIAQKYMDRLDIPENVQRFVGSYLIDGSSVPLEKQGVSDAQLLGDTASQRKTIEEHLGI